MNLVHTIKKFLPGRLTRTLSRAAYPYRHGRRFFRPYVIRKKEMEGVVFDFLVGDRTGRNWYDRVCINNPIWREMGFVRDRMIQKGDVIFECGGHHGCSAILLSNWVGPDGKVITFEPLRSNFEILEKNVRLNSLSNVVPKMEAVGAKAGTITFDEAISGISSNAKGVAVRVSRLDDYGYLNPTFLKIDVEGFELQVLQGAKAILARRPKLEIEVHAELLHQYGASVEDLFRLIDMRNYRAWVQWKDDQQPEEYDMSTPIQSRAHLFLIPLTSRR
jgi:FkbM family methyltransferase